ncbi:LysM peptidoglycan-binding domain-containing protein [Pseudactinotalea sp. Z1748]|uniref:LysM peptidoglycan-binding domain-containing protein n=1 Tax=Pseudactinotalea sp. Z1748 TaxID=3413027 RepID=UPI003C7C2BFD
MTLHSTARARHRADVRPTTFLSDLPVGKVARRGTAGVATAGLAFGLAMPAASADPDETYTVNAGDTVGNIAAQYGANIQEIISANGLRSDALIFPGDELTIPTSSVTSSAGGATHTVSAGDTVAAIAARYGAGVQAIIDANGLGADALIFPGDELTIPGGSGSSSGSASSSGSGSASVSGSGSASTSGSGSASVQRGTDTASRDGQRSAAPSPQASASGSAIVNIARQFVGTPYVWGGSTPAGFDCSGFTSYVYAQAGIDLPRNSGAQRSAGHVVSASQAQPGDLVWWPGHIGIYTGNGNHIAARNPGTALHESKIWRANPTFIRVA